MGQDSKMSDVSELRARIEKLSIEIDVQTEVLKHLEREKSLAQRQLNDVLDPIARLPLEISSEIFLHSLPPLPDPDACHVPHLLLNICNTWADIALSTPSLWTAIKITFPCASGFEASLQAWLQRAGNRPLSISLRGPGRFDEGIMCIIWRHGQQLKHLEICYDKEEEEDSDEDDYEDRMEFFGDSSPGPLPLLETLKIRELIALKDEQVYSGREFMHLLRVAPNLIECIFEDVYLMYDTNSEPDEILVLPALRRLVFGEYGKCPDGYDGILNWLSPPGLEALSLPLCNVSGDDLFAFLKRSSPPLKELILGDALDSGQLRRCLSLVPNLVRFEVWCVQADSLAELFAALAGSSSPFIPNLRSLTIQRCAPAIPDPTWKTLLRALAGRRTELHIVRIDMLLGAVKPTTPDILAGFGELVAGGMQLFIGTTKTNFLSG
ncbi:hypothetical protein B0H19DRAFT_1376709 [Mycena capillaripes]|nr:hypothetical protein B0H19DRAFT_1376709 [Mycena capillaripes]